MPDSRELVDALDDVVRSRGWQLCHTDEESGVYTAERPGGPAAITLAGASAGGLIQAIDYYEARTTFKWSAGSPIISGRPLDAEDIA